MADKDYVSEDSTGVKKAQEYLGQVYNRHLARNGGKHSDGDTYADGLKGAIDSLGKAIDARESVAPAGTADIVIPTSPSGNGYVVHIPDQQDTMQADQEAIWHAWTQPHIHDSYMLDVYEEMEVTSPLLDLDTSFAATQAMAQQKVQEQLGVEYHMLGEQIPVNPYAGALVAHIFKKKLGHEYVLEDDDWPADPYDAYPLYEAEGD